MDNFRALIITSFLTLFVLKHALKRHLGYRAHQGCPPLESDKGDSA